MPERSPESRPDHNQVEQLLAAYHAGNDDAFDQLFALLYDDLRAIGRHHLRRERTSHTLSTTALVHEIYLRIAGESAGRWRNRTQFFAFVSRAMRHFLVDYARRRGASKRGGQRLQVTLQTGLAAEERSFDLLEINDALERLAAREPRLARLVECRFFGGMSTEETAEALGISTHTVERDWLRAKAYLYRLLHPKHASA